MLQIVQAAFIVGIGRQYRGLRLVQIQACFPEFASHSCQVGLRQAQIIGQELITDLLCNMSCIGIRLECGIVFIQIYVHITQAGQEQRFLPLRATGAGAFQPGLKGLHSLFVFTLVMVEDSQAIEYVRLGWKITFPAPLFQGQVVCTQSSRVIAASIVGHSQFYLYPGCPLLIPQLFIGMQGIFLKPGRFGNLSEVV